MGIRTLDPVFQLLDSRNATVFVHPAAPGCKGADLWYPDPMSEYPFESVRAMENMLLTRQRANFTNINIIFPHGGGAMPYLATRIADIATLPFAGGLNLITTLQEFAGYVFDTASAATAVQLGAMESFFGGVNNIVTGTDYPYVPLPVTALSLVSTQGNGNFNTAQMGRIQAQNALSIFPTIVKKFGFASK
jgi:hypothetical protein